MARAYITIAAAALVAATSTPLDAHHSISRYYDRGERVTIEGVVVEFLLRNPHSQIRMQVAADSRGTQIWTLELDDVEDMIAQGADTILAGDEIVVTGNPARDGSDALFVRTLHRPADGLDYMDD